MDNILNKIDCINFEIIICTTNTMSNQNTTLGGFIYIWGHVIGRHGFEEMHRNGKIFVELWSNNNLLVGMVLYSQINKVYIRISKHGKPETNQITLQ